MNRSHVVLCSLSCLAVASFAVPASAQEPVPPLPPAAAPPPAPAAAAAPSEAAAPAESKTPKVSLALERVGGIGYARVSATDDDASVSAFTIGVGGPTVNPFAIPRLGLDFILPSGLTIGGALGFARLSASTTQGSKSEDIGSVFVYTFTPRVGYRIPLSDRVDITPRGGFTFLGASATLGNGKNDDTAGVFAVAVGADAPLAYRLTDSFNLLFGAGLDVTVAATATAGDRSSDIKGSLLSLQGWLGMGGYL